MVARASRRLPGFSFQVQSAPPTSVLPRMDVAVFVGFASSGPLHTPVAIEDAAHFIDIFGDDLPLVWDQQLGEMVYAYLAPAVRAFFRNGGRRCWVVRVAGNAFTNYLPISNLFQVKTRSQPVSQNSQIAEIVPAFAQARSAGTWSDTIGVGAALLAQPLTINGTALAIPSVDLTLNASDDLAVGDLLRLTFRDAGYVMLFPVKSIQPIKQDKSGSSGSISSFQNGTRATRTPVRVSGDTALYFRTIPPGASLPAPVRASLFRHAFSEEIPPVLKLEETALSVQGLPSVDPKTKTITLTIALPSDRLSDAPTTGMPLRVDFAAEQLWLTVQEVNFGSETSEGETVKVTGRGIWWLKEGLSSLPGAADVASCEKLRFELWVKQDTTSPTRLSNLAFGPGHPRFWGALPTDEQLYGALAGLDTTSTDGANPRQSQLTDLPQDVLTPRFPLAGSEETASFYIPLGMPVIPDQFPGPDLQAMQAMTALERNGLNEFKPGLFFDMDAGLIEATTTTLMAQADYLSYQSPVPRALQGIYAALSIEEATLIAAPDTVHRGWFPSTLSPMVLATPAQNTASLPAEAKRQPGGFNACAGRVLGAPAFEAPSPPDDAGTFTLAWSMPTADARLSYTLVEAANPEFIDGTDIYTGKESLVTIYGRGQGNYYYRVRAELGEAISDWSRSVSVYVDPGQSWRLASEDAYVPATLLAVQRALIRVCAARGDMLAILSLPEHFREDQAIQHVTTLTSPIGSAIAVDFAADKVHALLPPLGTNEANAFSYCTVYHPWLVSSGETQLLAARRTPPDGAALGIMARRVIQRGAWIAPANELFTDVVTLAPAIARERWLDLQNAQINLVRQEPRGFVALNSDTLSIDPDLRPINVRRLLILLRRASLRLGATYVFEPNSDAFRRLVQRGFEGMLDYLFVRGAFAGSTPATSYQVVTDRSLNSPQSVDQGRFIVELRVAPSLPMTFLTIRLVQTGERGTVTEV